MDIIEELVEYLPQIIVYLAVGFSFLRTYHFVALKQNSTDIQQVLTSSLVVGFLYCELARLIPVSISYYADAIIMAVLAACTGYVLGRISISAKIVPVLEFLKIRDHGNTYMWDDLMDKEYPFKIIVEYENKTYEGIAHNFESYSNAPHVSLASFVVRDSAGNVVEDYTHDNTRVVLLDTATAIRVDIVYDENSAWSKDIGYLCDYNNEERDAE